MNIILGILLTFSVFFFVVFIHELGHFLTARLTKMRVEEFGIGIPPKAKKVFTDKKGTDYTLNWIPLGGFVRIKGEDTSSPDASDKDAFARKKWWARALVLIAGVTMNFLLAYILLIGIFVSGARPIAPNLIFKSKYSSFFLPTYQESLKTGYIEASGVTLSPLTGSVAERAGIKHDDRVLQANGADIHHPEELINIIKKAAPLTLTLNNSGAIREVSLTPIMTESGAKIGAAVMDAQIRINTGYTLKLPLSQALVVAGKEVYGNSMMTLDFLGQTLKHIFFPKNNTERNEATKMVAGPIGLGHSFVKMVEMKVGASFIMVIVALLSLNLGVFNLLPLPALDGGRLLTTTIASLLSPFKKSKKYIEIFERYFHGIGFILLLLLSVAVAFGDIWRIIV